MSVYYMYKLVFEKCKGWLQFYFSSFVNDELIEERKRFLFKNVVAGKECPRERGGYCSFCMWQIMKFHNKIFSGQCGLNEEKRGAQLKG